MWCSVVVRLHIFPLQTINHHVCRALRCIFDFMCLCCSMIRQYDLITHDMLMHFNLFFWHVMAEPMPDANVHLPKHQVLKLLLKKKKRQWLEITPDAQIFRPSSPQQAASCFETKSYVAYLSFFSDIVTVTFVISGEVTWGERSRWLTPERNVCGTRVPHLKSACRGNEAMAVAVCELQQHPMNI